MDLQDFRKLLATTDGRSQLGLQLTSDEAAAILADDQALQDTFDQFVQSAVDSVLSARRPQLDSVGDSKLRPRWWRRRWVWVSGAAVIIIGAAIFTTTSVVAYVAHAGAKQSQQASRTRHTPEPFTANGTISIPADSVAMVMANGEINVGDPCTPRAGYSDIVEGAQVVITDAADTKLAVGELEAPTIVKGPSDSFIDARCEYPFQVSEVPGDKSLYSVHVGNTFRGEQTFGEDELYAGVELSVG